MRVLLVNTLFPPIVKGGAEISTYQLGAALAERGHEIHVMSVSPDKQSIDSQRGMTIHRVTSDLVPFPYGKARRAGVGKMILHALDNFNPVMARRAAGLISDLQPDIVHTNILQLLSCGIWSAAKSSGAKVVHNLRDYWLLCARSGFFRSGHPCSRKCRDCALFTMPRRHFTKDVDGVVAVSDYVLQTHLAAGLFPNAVTARAILSATDPTAVPRGPERVLPGTLTIGFIGRIKESKGVRVLLEAMRQVAPTLPVRLVIAGDGEPEYMDALRQLADERTDFVGWRPAEKFYAMVDLVVVPSLYPEPLPRTVLEAYRFDLPVIAAASGGIPEVVDNGLTGWLYSPLDVQELAALITAAMTADFATKERRAARAAVVAKTEPEYVVSAYEAVYAQVLG